VRNNKRLLLVAALRVVNAGGLNLWNAFGPDGDGWKGVSDLIPFLFFAIVLGTLWTRLSKMEAEHGPDYTPPSSPYARTTLVIAGLVALVLAAVATFLLLRRG